MHNYAKKRTFIMHNYAKKRIFIMHNYAKNLTFIMQKVQKTILSLVTIFYSYFISHIFQNFLRNFIILKLSISNQITTFTITKMHIQNPKTHSAAIWNENDFK